MRKSQRGLGLFGLVIVIAIAAVVGYYAYRGISGPDGPPSCRGALDTCMKICRRTTTEATSSQACQDSCQRDQDACERQRR